MGKFDFNFDQDFIQQLERLSDYDNIAPKLLEGAVPILKRYVVAETDKYHEYSQDRQLVNSIKAKKPSKNKYGWYVSCTPTGTDDNGVRNMEKMAHLEYGTSKMSAKPILTKALNDAQDEVTEKLQELFNEVVNEQ